MKEVKFRVWDNVNSKMLPVESIDFSQGYVSLNEGDNSVTDTLEIFELMQYIGLKDAGDKKVCVGDFLKDGENFIWEVLTLSDGMFKIACDDLLAVESAYPRAVTCEIIGNKKRKDKALND